MGLSRNQWKPVKTLARGGDSARHLRGGNGPILVTTWSQVPNWPILTFHVHGGQEGVCYPFFFFFFFLYLQNCRPIKDRTASGPDTSEIFLYFPEMSVHLRFSDLYLGVVYHLTEFWGMAPLASNFICVSGWIRHYVIECVHHLYTLEP